MEILLRVVGQSHWRRESDEKSSYLDWSVVLYDNSCFLGWLGRRVFHVSDAYQLRQPRRDFQEKKLRQMQKELRMSGDGECQYIKA